MRSLVGLPLNTLVEIVLSLRLTQAGQLSVADENMNTPRAG